MAFSINTNVNAMAAVRSLATISSSMEKTQARVETGLRINKASDDPAVFSISQAMRADIKGLTAVKDSLGFGKATLAVANAAAKKISDELATLKGTILQGQQQGIDQATIQDQVDNALANIQTYATTATFNGVNLLASGPGGTIDFVNLDIIRDIAGNTIQVANQDSTVAGIGLTGLDVANGAFTVTFDNAMAFANGDLITLQRNDGSQVIFEFNDGSTPLTSTPVADDPLTAANERVEVADVQYDAGTQAPLEGLDALVSRMKEFGFAASVQGNQLIVAGVDSTASSITVGAGATAGTLNGTDTAVMAINGAITNLGTKMATLGAASRQVEGLQDFTSSLYDSVKEGLGALVDADLAEESALLTTLQTKQQLAVQSLSIANQASSVLLTLFR